jgi:hypothetical protein
MAVLPLAAGWGSAGKKKSGGRRAEEGEVSEKSLGVKPVAVFSLVGKGRSGYPGRRLRRPGWKHQLDWPRERRSGVYL